MALQPGTRLGSYEITAAIGAGGMGEVYQARDTALNRNVAIKVLPEALAGNAGRLARFQREAEALAALNHPNIAQVYGLVGSDLRQEAGRSDSRGSPAIVMELVEGPTLADRIKKGPIPFDEAHPIARQIAEALEAAHERGIIHRDLKPANVKVKDDGTVKVLDFGLAKAMAPEPGTAAAEELANSPTVTGHATEQGVVLGTAGYMSPEQAKGNPVDRRADVWAFGAVLYEMLTGARAFAGSDVSEVLASVLARDPDWTLLPRDLPPVIGASLRRCLHKDPRERVPHASVMRLALEGAFDAVIPDAPAAAAGGRPPHLPALIAGALVVAVLTGSGVWLTTRPASAPELRLDIATPPYGGAGTSIAVSPDGTQVVFNGRTDGPGQLWLRTLDDMAAQPVAGTEGAFLPFWSPDGRSLGFFADGSLKTLDLTAGTVRVLADAVSGRGGTWNDSGTILFAPTAASAIVQIPADGGTPTPVTRIERPDQTDHRAPQFLPDGEHFLFYARGTPEGRGVYVGGLDGSQSERLLDADAAAVFAATGHLLFVRDAMLFASRFDVDRIVLVGDAIPLADGVNVDAGSSIAAVSASAAGPIAYRAGGRFETQLEWVDRSGETIEVIDVGGGPWMTPALHPDGRRAAVARNVDGIWDLWLIDTDRGSSTRLTSSSSLDIFPVWSTDGRHLVFASVQDEHSSLYLKSLSDSASQQLVFESPGVVAPTDWSADGWLLFSQGDTSDLGRDLWVLSPEGDTTPVAITQSAANERGGQFSPDGRWIAYESDESGPPDIFVQPFPGPGERTPVSTAGGTQPRWRADGQALFYRATGGGMMIVPVTLPTGGGGIEVGEPEEIFDSRLSMATGTQYAIAPDGRFLTIRLIRGSQSLVPISLILNWRGGEG